MNKKDPAIILSAGRSKRLGEPKALVQVLGKTLLEHSIMKLKKAGCEPIIVVVNHDLQFDALLVSCGATIVVNKNPENGRTGSLKVGINSLLTEWGRMPNRVIMCPVDRPGWKASHITKLLEQQKSSCLTDGVINGHPVSLVTDDLHNILSAKDDESLKQIVNFDAVSISNSLLSLNIDTDEDKLKLVENADFFIEL